LKNTDKWNERLRRATTDSPGEDPSTPGSPIAVMALQRGHDALVVEDLRPGDCHTLAEELQRSHDESVVEVLLEIELFDVHFGLQRGHDESVVEDQEYG
jgi:hypothetical protein